MKKELSFLLVLMMCLALCACGDGIAREHSHVFGEWKTVKEATCTEDGMQQRTCECGEIETQEIQAFGHTEVIDEAVEASCTEDGLSEGKHCATCGEILVEQKTVTVSHVYEKRVCVNCGAVQSVSTGLYFEKNSDEESYTLVSVGTCEDTEIVIPSTYKDCPVTSIGDKAFYECENITRIDIPDGVIDIGYGAFEYCENLTDIVIPDGVKSIGIYAFGGCSSLTNIEIPNSVTSIGQNAFYGCYSLKSIEFPQGLTTIEWRVCGGCWSLTSIKIPDSVTCIEQYAFHGCSGLESITIPSSVSTIRGVFGGCDNLTDFYYDGTYEQWNRIFNAIEEFAPSRNYTVHCTDGDFRRYE